MRKERILAVIMSVLLALSMIPYTVFAAETTALDGKLKIKGNAENGKTLSADFKEVKPEGLTEENVTYLWSRKTADDEAAEKAGKKPELKELGKEKTYTVTTEDVGAKIVLTITGKEENGFSGSLTAITGEVTETQTSEETPTPSVEVSQNGDSAQTEETQETAETVQESEENLSEELQPSGEPGSEEQEDTSEAGTEEVDGIPAATADETQETTEPAGAESVDGIPEATEDGTYGQTTDEESQNTDSATENGDGQSTDGTETPAETPALTITVGDGNSDTLDFGTVIAGQEENVEAQYVTVKNNSENTLTFPEISPENFVVNDIYSLEPGQEITLAVAPRVMEGREAKSYEDTITYESNEGAKVSFKAKMTIQNAETPDNPETPETPETPENPEVPENPGTSNVTPDTSSAEFEFVEGQTVPDAKTITLTNEGSAAAEMSEAVSSAGEVGGQDFDITWQAQTIEAGKTADFVIRPKDSLTQGTYEETFTITDSSTGKTNVITAFVTVDEVQHNLITSDTVCDFASAKEGYAEITAKQITVTNKGNIAETLTLPAVENFEIWTEDASKLTLAPEESVVFYVRPTTGLAVGSYSASMNVTSAVSVPLKFQVIKGTASLTKIQQPSAVSGLANGTKKEASALKLPSTVVIETTGGNMKASVSWNVKDCSYDPSSTDAQKFTVTGTVTLPSGVDNDNKIGLSASVEVSVKAYEAKIASAENNKITGIDANGTYTTQSKISFTAVGAGMDNASPRKGDTRYVPQSWKVINTNVWNAAPYTATFGLAKTGNYTLEITFRQQQYQGAAWKDTGKTDTRQVAFSVTEAKVTAPGTNLTPAANRTAVKTGDNTPILPFICILIVAAGAIAGVVVYKKKNKK